MKEGRAGTYHKKMLSFQHLPTLWDLDPISEIYWRDFIGLWNRGCVPSTVAARCTGMFFISPTTGKNPVLTGN
jgi:hypothetical protein